MAMTKTSKSRTRSAAVVPPTNAKDAEKILAQYAEVDAKIEQINATMDEAFTKVREQYAAELSDLSEKRNQAYQQMQMYAEANREELFIKKKSVDMSQGTIGYRTGTPKLKTAKGHTWAVVLKLLKNLAPQYVRSKEEPAKDVLLADRDKKGNKELYADAGLQVVQDETFYIDLKKEETDN